VGVGTDLSSIPSVGLSGVYYGKMADWIWMPFGMVSGVGRGMGVLDGVEIVVGKGAVLGVNVGHAVVINGNFAALLFSAVRLARLFPNDFGISC